MDKVICADCTKVYANLYELDRHECYESEDEPEEGDLTTTDHIKVYQYGKRVLDTTPDTFDADVVAYREREGFFPNVWFISDHGNAHLITLG